MENITGLCECGCGQKTNLAQVNDKRKGWVKGEPKRFVKWHHLRGAKRKPRKPLETYGKPVGWLEIEQAAMRERMEAKPWQLWANADDIQAEVSAKKRRKSKLKYYHKTLSAAACKSKVMRERREAIDARKAQRLAKRKLKIERKELREKARKRKEKEPLKEYNRILMLGVEMGRRMQKAEDQETKDTK